VYSGKRRRAFREGRDTLLLPPRDAGPVAPPTEHQEPVLLDSVRTGGPPPGRIRRSVASGRT
jgi:hypothetical protein